MFDSYPVELRAVMLHDNCDKVEEMTYMRTLSEDEKNEMRIEMADNLILISREDDKLDEAKAEYKNATKSKKDRNSQITKTLRAGSEEITGEVYKFIDFDTRMVGYYNSEGTLIGSRPAFANELTKTIQSEIRKIS